LSFLSTRWFHLPRGHWCPDVCGRFLRRVSGVQVSCPTPVMKISSTARKPWIALTLLSAIEFMILLDTSIVNIALPSIQTSLHFSEANLGWVQNIYQLVFGSLLLFGGRAADLFGRRKLYLFTRTSDQYKRYYNRGTITRAHYCISSYQPSGMKD